MLLTTDPSRAPNDHRYDVAVLGGGIMGSSTAYFLKTLLPAISVCVVEPDPTYAFASTLRASGGVRVLFSCPENIEMSKFSRDFIRRFPTAMAVDGRDAPVDWVEGGYLFIVPPDHMGLLESNFEIQRRHGCEVELLTPEALKARFPSMAVGDLGGGVHSTQDGWCDPNGLLQGFRRKAIALGAVYIEDRVTDLAQSATTVECAHLASGARIHAQTFVNAAGAWSAQLCAMAGMPLPVSPLRRFEHYFTRGNPIIGRSEAGLGNFYVLTGFSGHGMMHAPAAGRAIAELIGWGEFRTLDLTRLGYRRIAEGKPYPEAGII